MALLLLRLFIPISSCLIFLREKFNQQKAVRGEIIFMAPSLLASVSLFPTKARSAVNPFVLTRNGLVSRINVLNVVPTTET